MDDVINSVGQRVEKICPVCDKQLGHIVKSVTKLGKISRVICSECGKVGTFTKVSASLENQNHFRTPGSPYDRCKTYRVGQVMEHTSFGTGQVTAVLNSKMIDVLFLDRLRRLIHARP